MNTTKSTEAKIKLNNFNFDSHEVNLIHRQFSGERTQFISTIDELLRCWAMADSTNPNIQFNYELLSRVENGKAVNREQLYEADHVSVFFQHVSEKTAVPIAATLNAPKQLTKLYDLAFTNARPTLPAHTVASHFTLREVLARAAEYAVMVTVNGTTLSVFVSESEINHYMYFDLKLFGDLKPFVDQVNAAQ
jgi:hypothetical protein